MDSGSAVTLDADDKTSESVVTAIGHRDVLDTADFVALSESGKESARRTVGRVLELAEDSAEEAAPILEKLRSEILGVLEMASDEHSALAKLEEWRQKREGSDELATALWRPQVKADLGGRLFVFDVELQDRVKLRDEPRPAFLSLPFTEAIEYAEKRGLIDEEGLYDLLKLYRDRGDEASKLVLRILQSKTADALTKAVKEGSTLRDFIATVEAETARLELPNRDRRYLEMVFRTSTQSAYGAGRFQAMTTPAVMEARPFVQYRTAGDSRVRPAHAELDRKQWRITDTAWHRFAPPNGYNCRCGTVTLDPDEVDEGELNRELSADAVPDPEFDRPPVEIVSEPLVAAAQ